MNTARGFFPRALLCYEIFCARQYCCYHRPLRRTLVQLQFF